MDRQNLEIITLSYFIPWGSPTRPGTVHPTEASFVGEHDPQPTTVFCREPFGFSYRLYEALFFIVVLRLDVSVGMKGARHQPVFNM